MDQSVQNTINRINSVFQPPSLSLLPLEFKVRYQNRKNSEEESDSSDNSDEDSESSSSEEDDEPKVDNELSKMINILEKLPRCRKYQEIQFISKYLSHSKYFQRQFQDQELSSVVQKISRVIQYEYYAKGETVFRINQKGTKFYIILKGKVSCWKNIVGSGQELNKPKFQSFLMRKKSKRQSLLNIHHNDKLYKFIEFKDGQYFGEMSLESGSRRSALITCETDCHFATLTKADYQLILDARQQQSLSKNVQFLQQIPFFKNFDFEQIKHIQSIIYQQKYSRKDPVFTEGASSDYVYIVSSGQFTVYKQVPYFDEQGFKKNKKDVETQTQKYLQNEKKTVQNIEQNIKIMGSQEIFGEEDILLDQQRSFSVSCTSDGELLAIEKNKFLDFIYKQTKQSFDDLQIVKNKRIQDQVKQKSIIQSKFGSLFISDRNQTNKFNNDINRKINIKIQQKSEQKYTNPLFKIYQNRQRRTVMLDKDVMKQIIDKFSSKNIYDQEHMNELIDEHNGEQNFLEGLNKKKKQMIEYKEDNNLNKKTQKFSMANLIKLKAQQKEIENDMKQKHVQNIQDFNSQKATIALQDRIQLKQGESKPSIPVLKLDMIDSVTKYQKIRIKNKILSSRTTCTSRSVDSSPQLHSSRSSKMVNSTLTEHPRMQNKIQNMISSLSSAQSSRDQNKNDQSKEIKSMQHSYLNKPYIFSYCSENNRNKTPKHRKSKSTQNTGNGLWTSASEFYPSQFQSMSDMDCQDKIHKCSQNDIYYNTKSLESSMIDSEKKTYNENEDTDIDSIGQMIDNKIMKKKYSIVDSFTSYEEYQDQDKNGNITKGLHKKSKSDQLLPNIIEASKQMKNYKRVLQTKFVQNLSKKLYPKQQISKTEYSTDHISDFAGKSLKTMQSDDIKLISQTQFIPKFQNSKFKSSNEKREAAREKTLYLSKSNPSFAEYGIRIKTN